MKYIPILLMLSTAALRAQVPHIDYMMADEAKSQLQIHGTFTSDTTGFITIENTKQTVRSWSDTLLICDLPDSGAGSGGHVTVTQISGVSNVRMLSIFQLTFHDRLWYFDPNPFTGGFDHLLDCDWIVNWRADIELGAIRPTYFPFEISKTSRGEVHHTGFANGRDAILPYSDTIKVLDSSISLWGHLDLKSYEIKFGTAIMKTTQAQGLNNTLVTYQPLTTTFDATGRIMTYVDSLTYTSFSDPMRREVYLINSKILFPPDPKKSVFQSTKRCSNLIKIFSPISPEDHLISLEAEVPLGETTVTLYSIDGRLLKQEKIFISSAGMYSFDASGVNTRVGFLVLKSEKGIIAGKVLF